MSSTSSLGSCCTTAEGPGEEEANDEESDFAFGSCCTTADGPGEEKLDDEESDFEAHVVRIFRRPCPKGLLDCRFSIMTTVGKKTLDAHY